MIWFYLNPNSLKLLLIIAQTVGVTIILGYFISKTCKTKDILK